MKQRLGFVSNSSSSSFICDVCGENQSGMDLCLSDAEMFECVNGHTVCNDHKLPVSFETLKAKYAEDFEKYEWRTEDDYEERDDYHYGMYAEHCPICQFKDFITEDLYNYAIRLKLIDPVKLQQSIKDGFTTYKAFSEYMVEKPKLD